jgi:hypothetical protein
MIAVISSCLAPSPEPGHDGARTNIPVETRLAQTRESIASLVRLGFSEIHLADNSAVPPSPDAIAKLAPARVVHFAHFPYRNKGIAEARLLLALSTSRPPARPVMKLSGRYRASLNLCESLDGADFAGLFSGRGRPGSSVSTRAYVVRDRSVFENLLRGSLDELYAAPWRVVGPRSLLSLLRRHFRPSADRYPYADPLSSLEISTARWLRRSGLSIRPLPKLGVDGVIGSWINPAVSE